MRVLVADDSKTSLTKVTAALKKLGHDVYPVSSGAEAVKAFAAEHPDLVILDVVMDGMDGFECARQIRKLNSDDWIPIIFLSASVDDESISKGIDAGGDDYLTKPFSDITLAAKIKAMQRIADMRHSLFETTKKLILLSTTDPLTGINNRLQFERSIKDILYAADRYNRMVALLFIDLDNFKGINDTFGHQAGDQLLMEVAKRLKSKIRASDFVARLGGDEFAIVLTQIDEVEDAGNVANNIIEALASDYHINNRNIRNGASIGIACYPTPGTNKENFISNADIAMYHAKSLGRNNYQYFTSQIDEQYKQHLSIEHALKFAIERKEFYLTYQPIFNLKSQEIVGFETLVCWEHPKYGKVSPEIFIPIAEESGLINDIGNWILESTCAEFNDTIKNQESLYLTINVSSMQIPSENFVQNIRDLLDKANISYKRIELELTESAMMDYKEGIFKDTINKLDELGINISIDDFGTGYSSLIRLKQLPIKTLKIEKAFIQDALQSENGAIIVNCLIALGKNLKLNVIAEGIETKEQLEFLINNGCPQGQGYFLCKPVRAKSIEELLEKKNKRTT